MALTGGARWRPDPYRGTLSTTVQWRDKEAGDGLVIMTAELVAYDDSDFTAPGAYQPGAPETERKLIILDQQPVGKELLALAEMSQQEKDAEWEAALQAFWESYPDPVKIALATSMWAAKQAPPITWNGD